MPNCIGPEVLEPLPFPIPVCQRFEAAGRKFIQAERRAEIVRQRSEIGRSVEKRRHRGIGPEGRLTGQWFQDRFVAGIGEGHRERTMPEQYRFDLLRIE